MSRKALDVTMWAVSGLLLVLALSAITWLGVNDIVTDTYRTVVIDGAEYVAGSKNRVLMYTLGYTLGGGALATWAGIGIGWLYKHSK